MILLPVEAWAWEMGAVEPLRQGYHAPPRATRDAYGALVRTLAAAAPAGPPGPDAHAAAAALGLRLEVEEGVACLRERPGGERGAGVLAVRLGPLVDELVLAAPHPQSDQGTGRLVTQLFGAGEVRAVYVASVTRTAGPGADPSGSSQSWLTVATGALAEALPDLLHVQLHGFDERTSDADLVYAPGDTRPGRWFDAVPRSLLALGAADLRSGDDVPALAARSNAQGRLLARTGGRFLHLELSLDLRKALARGAALRQSLLDALLGLAGLP